MAKKNSRTRAGWRQPPSEKPDVPAPLKDKDRGVRLQKAMADAGFASRRDCEQAIADGRVMVNGEPVRDLPAWVDPAGDRIEVDGEVLNGPRRKDGRVRHTYVLLHKPRRVISTTDDPEGRKAVTDLVDLPEAPRLFPVGRLDADSTGLILLTNDGELANRLTHPRYGIEKRYLVTIRGKLEAEDVERLKKGLHLVDRAKPTERPVGPNASTRAKRTRKAAMERVRILKRETDRQRGDRTTVSITLKEGQNREIRRMLARLGYNVRKLKRVAIGPLQLKGVPVGGWRFLAPAELQSLRKAARL